MCENVRERGIDSLGSKRERSAVQIQLTHTFMGGARVLHELFPDLPEGLRDVGPDGPEKKREAQQANRGEEEAQPKS